VTTLLMGNCGVGFAPNVPGREAELIALMEGVEDIPGAALAEGVKFNWRVLATTWTCCRPCRTAWTSCLVPHDPLRMAVMGERALAQEAATPADIAAMQACCARRCRPARRLLHRPHRQPPHRARPGDTGLRSLGG
jgi:N-acyl-D-aspartate/D-glutamate deacylase